jgi:hypothetical protein
MHRDSYSFFLYEVAYFFEVRSKATFPIESVYWMRRKRNQIRSYPEKKYVTFSVELQYFEQAIKVILNRLFQSTLRIGFKSKCTATSTSNGPVYAWITNFHSKALIELTISFLEVKRLMKRSTLDNIEALEAEAVG